MRTKRSTTTNWSSSLIKQLRSSRRQTSRNLFPWHWTHRQTLTSWLSPVTTELFLVRIFMVPKAAPGGISAISSTAKATSSENSPVKCFKTSAIRTFDWTTTLKSVKFFLKQLKSSKTPHSLWYSNSLPITTIGLCPIQHWQPKRWLVVLFHTNSLCSLKMGYLLASSSK